MIRSTIITLALLVQPAGAATVHHWSGATENACQGRCDQAWAETQLTKEELTQLRAEQKRHPEPIYIAVTDGGVFSLMTYFKDGKALAYRTTTVAALDAPEGAMGWDMGDWLWVKLDACSNWAILKKQNVGSTSGNSSLAPIESVPQVFAAASVQSWNQGSSGSGPVGSSWSHGGTNWPSPVVSQPDCTRCSPIPPCPPVAAVPVPASALLLLSALFGIVLLKKGISK